MGAESGLRDPGSLPGGGETQHTGSNRGWRGQAGGGKVEGAGPSAATLLTHGHFSPVFTERPRASNSSVRKQMSGSFVFPF